MLNDFDLTGKKVLITGAGRGIGKGIAFAMAEAGADIAVTSLGGDTAVQVAEEVKKLGRKGFGYASDATRVNDVEALRDKVLADLGGVDILINNLGDAIRGTVSSMPGSDIHVLDEKDWHHVVDVNLTQAYTGCHVFGPHLLEKGGEASVINITSFAALRPSANMVAYAAGKAGLMRFTESLALEWAPLKVRVNSIAPGSFPDAYALSEADLAKRNADAAETIPLARMGHPREVGLMAVYLASSAASYVTGQTFVIDGGRTLLKRPHSREKSMPPNVTPERFAEGMTFDQYVAYIGTPENLQREGSGGAVRRDFSHFFAEAFRNTSLTEQQIEALSRLASMRGGPAKLLVISEDWSSDCRRDVPTFARIAAVTGMELRVFRRDGQSFSDAGVPSLETAPDSNADLMAQFLNHKNGETYQSIPVAAFFNRDFEYLYHYTEYPAIYEKDRLVGYVRGPRAGESADQTRDRGAKEFQELQDSAYFRIWASAAVDEIISALHRRMLLGEV